jgi:hypothetical protein
MALHGRQRLLVKHPADQTKILEYQHLRPVVDGDAGRLLAAMLGAELSKVLPWS